MHFLFFPLSCSRQRFHMNNRLLHYRKHTHHAMEQIIGWFINNFVSKKFLDIFLPIPIYISILMPLDTKKSVP